MESARAGRGRRCLPALHAVNACCYGQLLLQTIPALANRAHDVCGWCWTMVVALPSQPSTGVVHRLRPESDGGHDRAVLNVLEVAATEPRPVS